MHIALYTHSVLPVQGYGGTQRVVVWLARGLAELGHQVTVLAPSGTRLREARVIELNLRDLRRPDFQLSRWLPGSADIVHTHAPLVNAPGVPFVFTLHGNRAERTAPPNTIFLSADHARRHAGSAFVYNGVDPTEYVFRSVKADYDLFLGRLHRIKGYRWAIEGTRRSRRRLIIAGGWRPTFLRSVRYIRSVNGSRKANLLADAECLWMPALWDEPFGLTLVEAMMSGTPVLGTKRGALPEIVSPEVGALGDTLEELVDLRSTVQQCDPAACRSRAERWFAHTTMAQEYVRMYQHFLKEQQLPAGRRIT